MAVDGDAQYLTLHSPIEALGQSIPLRRVGLFSVFHLRLAAGVFKAIGREGGYSTLSVRICVTLKGKAHHLIQEGDRTCGQHVVFDGQMHPAGVAVDGHIQISACCAPLACHLQEHTHFFVAAVQPAMYPDQNANIRVMYFKIAEFLRSCSSNRELRL